jgi:hypothetical protein
MEVLSQHYSLEKQLRDDNFHQLSQAADLLEQRRGPNGSIDNKTRSTLIKRLAKQIKADSTLC